MVSSLLGFAILLTLLALGMHVASVLFVIGIGGAILSLGQAVVLDFGNQVWTVLNNFVMISIPLFILL